MLSEWLRDRITYFGTTDNDHMSSGGILYFVGLSSLPPIKLRAQDHHERVESLFLSSEERKEVSVFNHVLGVQQEEWFILASLCYSLFLKKIYAWNLCTNNQRK